MNAAFIRLITRIFKRAPQQDADAVEDTAIVEMLRLARRLDSVEKASFLAFMSAMTDDGADVRKALEISNRVLTAVGRVPLWFYENCAPVSDTADIDMMATQ